MKYEKKPAVSPSSRLRAVMFLFWQKQGSKGDFKVWYKDQMERIIDKIKKKLN